MILVLWLLFLQWKQIYFLQLQSLLIGLRKKQTRELKQQTVPRLPSCFNVGFKLSLMSTDNTDNQTNPLFYFIF